MVGSGRVQVECRLGSVWFLFGFLLCSSFIILGFQLGSIWVLVAFWTGSFWVGLVLIRFGWGLVGFLFGSDLNFVFQFSSGRVLFWSCSGCVPDTLVGFWLCCSMFWRCSDYIQVWFWLYSVCILVGFWLVSGYSPLWFWFGLGRVLFWFGSW